MELYLVVAVVAAVLGMVLGDEIQDGIRQVLGGIRNWAAADGRATAVVISISVLMVAALVVVAIGVYGQLCMYLRYVLVEAPPELPLAMTVLSSALGLSLHWAKGPWKVIAAVLAVLFIGSFGMVAYLTSSEMMAMENEEEELSEEKWETQTSEGYQPYAAASLVALGSAMELTVAYILIQVACNATGYLWMVPAGVVLIPIYVLAWLLANLKSKVVGWLRWLFTGKREGKSGIWTLLDVKQSVDEAADEERDKTVKRGFILTYQWTRFWQWITSFFSGLPNARKSTRTASEALDERCKEVKRNMNGKARCKELVTILVTAAGLSSADAQGRSVFVLVDGTDSYPHTEQARQHIVNYVIPSLGPGDNFWMAMLGNFDSQLPAVTSKMPLVQGVKLSSWESLFEWKKSRKALDRVWSNLDTEKAKLVGCVEAAIQRQKGGTTRLYTWLSYGSALLASSTSEHWLIVYSDMHEDHGEVSTRLPPKELAGFRGVKVRILHVPFEVDWVDVKEKWEKWFTDAGAESVEMYPVGVSVTLDSAFPKSKVPQEMPRFSVAGGRR